MDLKLTITRSFNRLVNTGNYENATFYAQHSLELSADHDRQSLVKISEALHLACVDDVQKAVDAYLSDKKEQTLDKLPQRRPSKSKLEKQDERLFEAEHEVFNGLEINEDDK